MEVKAQLLGSKLKGEKVEVVVEAPSCSLSIKLPKFLSRLASSLPDKKGVIQS